jgi:prepilin signal peptidase PulO-like enzyme (type II secretory pathway)
MALGYVVTALFGLALGLLVNWLAGWLPQYAVKPEPPEGGEPAGEAESVSPPGDQSQSRWWGPTLRAVLVELFLAGMAVYLWQREGTTLLFAIFLFYTAIFTLIAVIDIETKLVLNVLMLPAFVIALIEVFIGGRFANFREPFAGYAIAQIAVMGIYLLGQVYLGLVNRKAVTPVDEVAFGFGDVTLATYCGLVIGYPRVLFMLVLMILLGAFFAILYVLISPFVKREVRSHMAMPYGPAIVVAALLFLLWGEPIARLMGAP